jgi:hypothetical protein
MRALKNPRHETFGQAHARGMSASAAEENAVLIKKPEKTIKRDEMGRFDRRADRIGQGLAGPGRPKGSLNKTTTQLKEAILGALEAAGGKEGSVGYLTRLAVENSSAFASLLGKILPSTLAAASESDGGLGVKMVFERHIVCRWPSRDRGRDAQAIACAGFPCASRLRQACVKFRR